MSHVHAVYQIHLNANQDEDDDNSVNRDFFPITYDFVYALSIGALPTLSLSTPLPPQVSARLDVMSLPAWGLLIAPSTSDPLTIFSPSLPTTGTINPHQQTKSHRMKPRGQRRNTSLYMDLHDPGHIYIYMYDF
jgi:hypothetical protein